MYIRFNTNTKKIVYMGERKPLNEDTELYNVAEFNGVIPKADYLTVENVQSRTRVIEPAHMETRINDNNEEETIEIADKTENYLSCELKANFYTFTPEQIEARKLKKYSERSTQLIRMKYDANAVEALLANYTENKEKYQEEFNAFAKYRKECKAQAHIEVYGR